MPEESINVKMSQKEKNDKLQDYVERREAQRKLTNYQVACNALANHFCEKHNFYYLSGKPGFRSWWVGERFGEVLAAADYFFDMSTIVDDITLDIPEEWLIEWYDYRLDGGEMNYRSWARKKQDDEDKN